MYRHTPIIMLALATVSVLWYGVSNQVEVNLSANALSVRTNVRSKAYFTFDQGVSETPFAKALQEKVGSTPISLFQREAMGKLVVTMDKIEKGDRNPDLLWQSLFYLYQLREVPCMGDIPEAACMFDDTRSIYIVEESLARLHFKEKLSGDDIYGTLLVELGLLKMEQIASGLSTNKIDTLVEKIAGVPNGTLQHKVGSEGYEMLASSITTSIEHIIEQRQRVYAVDVSTMGL